MFVHALVSAIGTGPKPPVLLVLHGLDEILADLLSSGSRVTVFVQYDRPQLVLIPIIHCVIFFLFLFIARVGIEVLLSRLPFHTGVMAELALATLLTISLLEKDAEDSFGVDAKGDFLHLHWLKQLCSLSLSLFRCCLFLLSTDFLRFLSLLVGALV